MLYNGYRRAQHPGHRRQAHPSTSTTSPTPTSRWPCPTTPPTSSSCSSTTPPACALLRSRGVSEDVLAALPHFGLSSICNIVAAIKTAKTLDLGASQALITVATDGAALYTSEIAKAKTKHFGAGFGTAQAAQTYATHITQANTQHVLPLTEVERRRIFNLGYFTWVEQRGIELAAFEARRDQSFWRGLHAWLPAWDAQIAAFNQATGVTLSAPAPRRTTREHLLSRSALVCVAAAGSRRRRTLPLCLRPPRPGRRRAPAGTPPGRRRRARPQRQRQPLRALARSTVRLACGARAGLERCRLRRAWCSGWTMPSLGSTATALPSPPSAPKRPWANGWGWKCGSRTRPHNVAGSHKARHLMGLLLYLAVVEGGPGTRRRREPRRRWPLPVAATPRWLRPCWRAPLHGRCRSIVPPDAERAVLDRLRRAGRHGGRLPARARRAGRPLHAPLPPGAGARRAAVLLPGQRKRPDHRRRADAGAGDAGRRRPAAGPSGGAGGRRRAGQRLRAGLRARAGPGPGAPGAARARGADAGRGAAGTAPGRWCSSAWPSRPSPPMSRCAYAASHRSQFMWPWEEAAAQRGQRHPRR